MPSTDTGSPLPESSVRTGCDSIKSYPNSGAEGSGVRGISVFRRAYETNATGLFRSGFARIYLRRICIRNGVHQINTRLANGANDLSVVHKKRHR